MITNAFQSGPLMALMNPGSYTPAISDYLQAERKFVRNLLLSFSGIIEAGCADGRYYSEAAASGKDYTGIDIAPLFIESARMQHTGGKFICADIEHELNTMLTQSRGALTRLIIFPFNVFGNLRNPERIAATLSAMRASFAILGYDHSSDAFTARLEYYQLSGFHELQMQESGEGTRFYDGAGLNSMAYSATTIHEMFRKHHCDVAVTRFGEFGQAAVSF